MSLPVIRRIVVDGFVGEARFVAEGSSNAWIVHISMGNGVK